MKLRRIVALVSVLSLAIGTLVGCGASGKGKGVNLDDEITITVTGCNSMQSEWGETGLVSYLAENFGVTMECTPVDVDAWSSKFSLMFAEDDLADLVIIPATSMADVNKYGAEEYFLPINEYLDYAPNIKAFFEEHPEYEKACTSPDGNIYTLRAYDANTINKIPRVYIDSRWLENLGLEMPKTVDELYDVLVAFKEKDANGNGDPNDEIPMAFAASYARTFEHALLPAFGIESAGASTAVDYLLQVKDGEVTLANTSENYKAYLKFMNKLWEQGIIYDESYSTKIDTVRNLVKEGKVGIFSDAAPYIACGNGDPTDDQYFELFGGFTSEYQDTPTLVTTQTVGKPMVLINSWTEYPEKIVSMLDFFFTAEGQNVAQYGDYEVEYENLNVEGYEEYSTFKQEVPDGYESFETYRTQKLTINGAFSFVSTPDNTIFEAIMEGPVEKLDNFALSGDGGWAAALWKGVHERNIELVEEYPTVQYDEEVENTRASIKADVLSYLKSSKSQFITGEVDIDSGWDAYLKQLENMKLSRLLEIERDAYDEWSE